MQAFVSLYLSLKIKLLSIKFDWICFNETSNVTNFHLTSLHKNVANEWCNSIFQDRMTTLTEITTTAVVMLFTFSLSSTLAATIPKSETLKLVWFPSNVSPPLHLNQKQPFIRVLPSRRPKQLLGTRYLLCKSSERNWPGADVVIF